MVSFNLARNRLLYLFLWIIASCYSSHGEEALEAKNAEVLATNAQPQIHPPQKKLIAKAKGGHVESMIAIRHRMLDGEKFDITQDALVNLIQKAAEQGNPDAQCEMGIIFGSDEFFPCTSQNQNSGAI